MNNSTNIIDVCSCRFTVRALCDFIDTFGRAPMSSRNEDCAWVGKRIDIARNFSTNERFQKDSGRFAIVNYWKCRRMGKLVPVKGNKVALHPLDK
jgi:hypothetical protein